MSLRDTALGLLASPPAQLELTSPRRLFAQGASASPFAQVLPLNENVLLRGDAIYWESINAFISPASAITITDMSLSLANGAGSILALLGQPVITTLSPASETSLYFPVPAMILIEDLIQWSNLAAVALTQPFQLRLRIAWTPPATNISLRTQAKYRIIHGQQEG